MQVQQILKSKGVDEVFTVVPGTTLAEAVKILAEKRIGTVVVSEDGSHATGILSERDVVRVLSAKGEGCLADTVDMHMTSKLVTCSLADRADEVLAQMTEGRFRHMPVVEDGMLVGLITLGDAVKAKLSELAMENSALEGMIMGH